VSHGTPAGSAAAPRGGTAPDRHVAFPIIVAAPSGTGKTTVCRKVVERDDGIVFSISHTTRPQRSGETDGEDYHFVAADRFEQLVAEGAFLEWAVYNDHRYGTSWAAIDAPLAAGRDVLLVDDILDTGRSLAYARALAEQRDAARIWTCVLLDKPSRREVAVAVDFVGFSVGDVFVAGYGIDYAEKYRHLTDIVAVE